MKFPKLKHTVLCQVLLYIPGLSILLWVAALILIPGTWKDCTPLMLGGFFLTGGLSLWYLLHNFSFLLFSDMLFHEIRQWKKDRTEYRTRCNGNDRMQIRKTILRRCSLWGKSFELPEGSAENVDVYYRHGYSPTYFWSAIEKRVAICSTDTLSTEQYYLLMDQARRLLSRVPNGKIRFKTKEERKAPRVKANVIVILADTVEEEVKVLARKTLGKSDDLCFLPCVIQCSDGCYYTNCSTEYYEQGLTPRTAVNFAVAMIRKLVFARHLPDENKYTQPAPDFAFELDMSLWEYCKAFGNEVRETNDSMKKDRVKAFRRMRNGETCIGEGVIWYKCENKLAEYAILPDEEDETLVTIISDEVWYYKKDDGFLSSALSRSSFSRKKMKKGEAEKVQKSMESKLISEGYRIERD